VELVPFPVNFVAMGVVLGKVDLSAETCYACDRTACTVEHCPPKSFFPNGKREQLMTVGSCPAHNNENSKDVEYTRNVLTSVWGVNTPGLDLFAGKVLRSLERSPGLLISTFGSMQTIAHEGQITGIFRIDTGRMGQVFESCAKAIHYRDTRNKHRNWAIIAPQLMFAEEVPDQVRSNWDQLIGGLRTISFTRKPVSNPEVFEYGTGLVEEHHFYCLFFYQAFVVYAAPLPDGFPSVRL
jgi:hypothetical protein